MVINMYFSNFSNVLGYLVDTIPNSTLLCASIVAHSMNLETKEDIMNIGTSHIQKDPYNLDVYYTYAEMLAQKNYHDEATGVLANIFTNVSNFPEKGNNITRANI